MKTIRVQQSDRRGIYGIILVCFLSLFAFIAVVDGQSLFDEDSFGNDLYKDITARKVGDTVTVIIFQNAQADQSTQTSRDQQAAFDASLGIPKTKGGLLSLIHSAPASAKASGQTSSSENRSISRKVNFIATVTAQVVEVFPNGQLKIEGHQQTSINDQETEISVSGIINKTDIAADNTVSSSLLADAKIEYREPSRPKNIFVSVVAFSVVAFLVGTVLGWIF